MANDFPLTVMCPLRQLLWATWRALVQIQFKVQQPQDPGRRGLKWPKVVKKKNSSKKISLLWKNPDTKAKRRRDIKEREKSNFWTLDWTSLFVEGNCGVNIEVIELSDNHHIQLSLGFNKVSTQSRLRLRYGWNNFVFELPIVYFRSQGTWRISYLSGLSWAQRELG